MSRIPLAAAVVAVAVGSVSGAACGDEIVDGEARPQDERTGPAAAAGPAPLYDADGHLLPSEVVVAGLPLPRGLELVVEEDRARTYRTEAPMTEVQRYFGTRLVTGEVDRLGGGAVYRNAIPRGVQGTPVRLDVSILPMTGGRTRVSIIELPPAPLQPPTEAQYEEALRQAYRRGE